MIYTNTPASELFEKAQQNQTRALLCPATHHPAALAILLFAKKKCGKG
jgi:hypothetical protein